MRNFGADRVLFASCAPRFEIAVRAPAGRTRCTSATRSGSSLLSGNAAPPVRDRGARRERTGVARRTRPRSSPARPAGSARRSPRRTRRPGRGCASPTGHRRRAAGGRGPLRRPRRPGRDGPGGRRRSRTTSTRMFAAARGARRRRRPGQQRGHPHRVPGRGHADRDVRRDDRGQPAQRLPLLPGRAARHAGPRLRPHHQHRLPGRSEGWRRARPLRRREGRRHRAVTKSLAREVGGLGVTVELHRARPDRHPARWRPVGGVDAGRCSPGSR